jgi:hypothetical protein
MTEWPICSCGKLYCCNVYYTLSRRGCQEENLNYVSKLNSEKQVIGNVFLTHPDLYVKAHILFSFYVSTGTLDPQDLCVPPMNYKKKCSLLFNTVYCILKQITYQNVKNKYVYIWGYRYGCFALTWKTLGHLGTGHGNFLGLKKFSACSTKFFSYCFVKLKYYVNFNNISQFVHSNAHFNPFQGVFSDKLIIIFKFAEIFNSLETWSWKVLNFSHVWFCHPPS